ncbi:methionyl-tRNA formyltransferase [Sulfurivirga sp.]|uniref:methionyl-tRNA formyltransferase n=1 Tax=Sulfurivirga sp. TaxID=2614236 RepID=UPI0025EBD9DB|nr:methionyl-tRNA formyltransferase [Sulfurivirga sp.]
MRVVFAGTPEFSVAPLRALIDAGHQIVGVYTQPDRPAGRGMKLRPSPVKQVAQEHGLPVFQPETLKTPEARAQLAALEPEVMVVVAYGLILPRAILDTPKKGCLNIHASLLPRWRGAAPIQRAIEAGDAETGVTIMQMDEGLDTGPMLLKKTTPITPQDTAQTLHDRLSALGAEAIVEALENLDRLTPEPQDESQATYAKKLTKAEGEIDWSQPAEVIRRKIHAFSPWPTAFTQLDGKPLKLLTATALPGPHHDTPGEVILVERDGIDIACGEGLLRVHTLQPAGKRPMPAADFANGHALLGKRLGG